MVGRVGRVGRGARRRAPRAAADAAGEGRPIGIEMDGGEGAAELRRTELRPQRGTNNVRHTTHLHPPPGPRPATPASPRPCRIGAPGRWALRMACVKRLGGTWAGLCKGPKKEKRTVGRRLLRFSGVSGCGKGGPRGGWTHIHWATRRNARAFVANDCNCVGTNMWSTPRWESNPAANIVSARLDQAGRIETHNLLLDHSNCSHEVMRQLVELKCMC